MNLTKKQVAELVAKGATASSPITLANLILKGAVVGKPMFEEAVASAALDGDTCIVRTVHFVTPSVTIDGGKLTAVIPCILRSEANKNDKLRQKLKRKMSVKKAVKEALGPHAFLLALFAEAYHRGKVLRIVFTRLGGRRLDRGNLAVSFKTVEDILEGALLANDGSPLWQSSYEQEPGGPVGVRIELTIVEV